MKNNTEYHNTLENFRTLKTFKIHREGEQDINLKRNEEDEEVRVVDIIVCKDIIRESNAESEIDVDYKIRELNSIR